jgi:hypothetical protein
VAWEKSSSPETVYKTMFHSIQFTEQFWTGSSTRHQSTVCAEKFQSRNDKRSTIVLFRSMQFRAAILDWRSVDSTPTSASAHEDDGSSSAAASTWS